MQTDCFPDVTTAWGKSPVRVLAEINPRYPVRKGHKYPFIEMASVRENFGGIQHIGTRKMEGSGLSRFKVGDTLFAKITPCPENGKVAYVGELPAEFGIGSTEFIILSPRNGCHPRFLYHLLCCHAVRGRATARMEGSTGRQRVPDDVFEKRLLVPVPKPDEQAAIARILDAVDTAIERTREALERARQLRESLLHQFIRFGVRNEPQKKSEAGFIPVSWDCEPLGNHIKTGPTNGIYRPESDYGTQGTRIVRIDSFANGEIHDIASLRRVKVEPVIEERYALREADLLINRVNSLSHIGKAAIVPALDEPTIFESNMMALRCGERLMPQFLILVLCSDIARRHWLSRAKPAVNQASVNQRDVRELPVPLPSLDEQKHIAQILSMSTVHIQRLVSVMVTQQSLKRSLMHDLLTGKVRVNNLNLDRIAAA